MKYELWSAESGNRLGSYDGLDELTAVLRAYAELNGAETIEDLFAREWPAGAAAPAGVLTGDELRVLTDVRLYEVSALPVRTATGARPIHVGRAAAALAV